VLTKSGTNSIHGSAYEYYYGSGTSANSWQLNSLGRHRPHSVNNVTAAPLAARSGRISSLSSAIMKAPLLSSYNDHPARSDGHCTQMDSDIQGLLARIRRERQMPWRQTCTVFTSTRWCLQPLRYTGTAACDPRGLGMDALIKSYFALLPEPNNLVPATG